MSYSMHDAMDVLAMFPDKTANSWVGFQDFWSTVLIRIDGGRAFDREIVNDTGKRANEGKG